MQFSIITVTLNNEKTIKENLSSVANQSINNYEHIIVDGGSEDGTMELIEKYRSGKSKIATYTGSNIYEALNKGIEMAKGDLIGILHGDDRFASPKVLEKISEAYKRLNSPLKPVAGLYGNLVYINRKDRIVRYWKSCMFKKHLPALGWMPAHPTLFLRREVFNKHGTYNTSLKIASDYDFMLRILKDQTLRFEYLPFVITEMRMGGTSNNKTKNLLQKLKEDYWAIRKNNIGGIFTLFLKKVRKISQFLIRPSANDFAQ